MCDFEVEQSGQRIADVSNANRAVMRRDVAATIVEELARAHREFVAQVGVANHPWGWHALS